MTYRILFIISALVFASMVNGQQLQVINSSDHSSIENVAVYNSTREKSNLTDSLGLIDLSIFPHSDTLFFQHPSFISRRLSMAEIAGQKQIELQRKRVLWVHHQIKIRLLSYLYLFSDYCFNDKTQRVIY